MKFHCRKCGKKYTEAERAAEPFCDCGARRIVSFGKIPEKVPNEIKFYAQRIFEKAEKSFGYTKGQLVYEKAFILLALLNFLCSKPEETTMQNLDTLYGKHRKEVISVYHGTIEEFKKQGFRTPTSAMPGMAEDEMLGTTPNELKITNTEFCDVRAKLMNLSAHECEDSIEYLEIQLKNKLYE